MCKELTDEQAESVVGGKVEIIPNPKGTTTIKLTEIGKEFVVNQSFSHVSSELNRFKEKNRGKYANQSRFEKAVEDLMRRNNWI